MKPAVLTLLIPTLLLMGCSPEENQPDQDPTAIASNTVGEEPQSEIIGPTTSSTATSQPTPTEEPTLSAEEFARQTAIELLTWNTATDRTETAAALRLKPKMTKELANKIEEPQRNSSQALWNELYTTGAKSQPYIEEKVITTAAPPDTDTTAYRAYRMTWLWIDPDGSRATPTDNRVRNVDLKLTKEGKEWKLADYTMADVPNW